MSDHCHFILLLTSLFPKTKENIFITMFDPTRDEVIKLVFSNSFPRFVKQHKETIHHAGKSRKEHRGSLAGPLFDHDNTTSSSTPALPRIGSLTNDPVLKTKNSSIPSNASITGTTINKLLPPSEAQEAVVVNIVEEDKTIDPA